MYCRIGSKQLADEARALAPNENEARIRAMIALRESGPEVASQLLVGQEGADSLHFMAALLLDMGRVTECEAVLERIHCAPSLDAEGLRLQALSAIARKDLMCAQSKIQKAIALEPRWVSIRAVTAVIG